MFVKVNEINIHYETFGEGKPIILLHGNGECYKIFDILIEKLKSSYKVYAIDSRCHGESDNPKEITYDLMCDDIIKLIKELNIEKPIFYGFSDGGIIGLLIALKEPDLLSNLIISGAQLNPNACKIMDLIITKAMYYLTRKKLFRLMVKEPNIKPEELSKITIPVHVIAGEKDVIKKEHTELISKSIPNSTLEIIPGENHGSYIIHSEKLYGILKKYL